MPTIKKKSQWNKCILKPKHETPNTCNKHPQPLLSRHTAVDIMNRRGGKLRAKGKHDQTTFGSMADWREVGLMR